MLKAMPSPSGSNRAGLYIIRNDFGAAYDSVPVFVDPLDAGMDGVEGLSADACEKLLEFLRGKVSSEDLAEIEALFTKNKNDDLGQDDPPPVKGMPQTGGKIYGEDKLRKLISDARRRQMATDSKDREAFEKANGIPRFRIRNLG
jgi:hypothetical protein